MTSAASDFESDRRIRLAEVRTALAEKRTLLSELQLSLFLITLPLTIHTGLTVLAGRHALIERLHVVVPFWAFLVAMLPGGLWLALHSVRALVRVNLELRQLGAGGSLGR